MSRHGHMGFLDDGRVIDYKPLCWNPAHEAEGIPERTALWIAFDDPEGDLDEGLLALEYAEFHPERGWLLIGGPKLPAECTVYYWARPGNTPPKPSGGSGARREPKPEPALEATA